MPPRAFQNFFERSQKYCISARSFIVADRLLNGKAGWGCPFMLHKGKVQRSHFAPMHGLGVGLKREKWGMKREALFFLYNFELHLSGNV